MKKAKIVLVYDVTPEEKAKWIKAAYPLGLLEYVKQAVEEKMSKGKPLENNLKKVEIV